MVTRKIEGARVHVRVNGEQLPEFQTVAEFLTELVPGKALVESFELPEGTLEEKIGVGIFDANEKLILAYFPRRREEKRVPEAATEPELPQEIKSIEKLYLTGLHL